MIDFHTAADILRGIAESTEILPLCISRRNGPSRGLNADRRKRWRRDQAARDAAYVEEKASAKRKRKRARHKGRGAGDDAGADLPAPCRAAYGPWPSREYE